MWGFFSPLPASRSGLDSYSAQSLMEVLKKIADAGATVIVTIHQPPPPVVRKIDNLLLLLGGRLLYDGPMGLAVEETFRKHLFPKPEVKFPIIPDLQLLLNTCIN